MNVEDLWNGDSSDLAEEKEDGGDGKNDRRKDMAGTPPLAENDAATQAEEQGGGVKLSDRVNRARSNVPGFSSRTASLAATRATIGEDGTPALDVKDTTVADMEPESEKVSPVAALSEVSAREAEAEEDSVAAAWTSIQRDRVSVSTTRPGAIAVSGVGRGSDDSDAETPSFSSHHNEVVDQEALLIEATLVHDDQEVPTAGAGILLPFARAEATFSKRCQLFTLVGVIVVAAAVGGTAVSMVERNNGSDQTSRNIGENSNIPTTALPTESPTFFPTFLPTMERTGFPTFSKFQAVATTEELYEAVDQYLADSRSNTTVAETYGHPIGVWDVSRITDFSWLFNGGQFNITTGRNPAARTFNENIEAWDMSRATNLQGMFQGAHAFNQPLQGWNTSRVVNMFQMFFDAYSFNQPLEDWNVSSVGGLSWMFWEARSFNQPLSAWDVSGVCCMDSMFLWADSFNGDVSGWDVSRVINFNTMFQGTPFNQPLDGWDTSSATNFGSMFRMARVFNQSINNWNVSRVTNMNLMFDRAESFNAPLFAWDVGRVESMERMFYRATSFNQDLSMWSISSLREAQGMFFFAQSFSQDLCGWGPQMQNDTRFDLVFYQTSCPVDTIFNIAAEPRGPFCFDCNGSSSVLIDNATASSVWETLSLGIGGPDERCFVQDNCIASHALAGRSYHASDQFCGFRARVSGTLMVETFSISTVGSDYLWLDVPSATIVEGYIGDDPQGLDNRTIPAGTSVIWGTGSSSRYLGWRICLLQ